MKDRSNTHLLMADEELLPEIVQQCLDKLVDDMEHRSTDEVVFGLSYEELVIALSSALKYVEAHPPEAY